MVRCHKLHSRICTDTCFPAYAQSDARAIKRGCLVASTVNDENVCPAYLDMDDEADELGLDATFPPLHASISVSPGRPLSTGEERQLPHMLTPTTPRHHDALSKKVVVTPKHRTSAAAMPAMTPRTPRTPSTPLTSSITIYKTARRAFTRSAHAGPLIGRAREREELQTFLQHNVSAQRGGCVYVSGPPGSGKTALVQDICQNLEMKTPTRYSCINCMSIKSSNDIFNTMISELGISDDVFGDHAKQQLEEAFLGKGAEPVYILALDEIDQIINIDVETLYTIFDWSLRSGSRLLLIGIANALDLTDRFLPRLKARNLKPFLLPFLPYDAAQIAAILRARIQSLLPAHSTTTPTDFTPFIHPTAIQLISKKVAAQSGDLRKAFDIALRAIEVVEAETKDKLMKQGRSQLQSPPSSPNRKPLAENNNLSSPCSSLTSFYSNDAMASLTVESAPRATLVHIVHVTSATFGNGVARRVKTLNLHQQAVLCALSAMEEKNRNAVVTDFSRPTTPSKSSHRRLRQPTSSSKPTVMTISPTVKELYLTYSSYCRRTDMLHPLSSSEFREVIGNLETVSLVAAADEKTGLTCTTASRKGRGGSLGAASVVDRRRISACVALSELEKEVKLVGGGILSKLLRDLST